MFVSFTLSVKNLDRTETFYREILNLPIQHLKIQKDMPELLLLKEGTTTLLFRERAVMQAYYPTIFAVLDRYPCGLGMMIDFEVRNLRQIHHRIEERQIPVLYELEDNESGWQEVWLHDPDGYLLVLSQKKAPKN